MCATCGCSGNEHKLTAFLAMKKPEALTGLTVATLPPGARPGVQSFAPDTPVKTVIELERDILEKNNRMAERNRGFFEARNILAINLVSSPGSGKTALLERTLADLGARRQFFVVEGDQQTARDAERIAAGGAPVVQINTGKGCHLEAHMVHQAIRQLQPTTDSIVFIENVGNLVCPSMFDLGEGRRVIVISVTEGEDKPVKYPDMFRSAQLCVINKVDLLPYLKFDVQALKEYARQVNPQINFIEVSATSGQGMETWYAWLGL
ncbi:MAG: hydrogenase nickel incorporation protein HypB [Saprospirales bacterium]|jgi:hydrogenase nickel incorporation protein HypB|nr:hydrogenase nickel incorporation protein HypB [Saprospirales bacterium]MBK8923147.1 hydrogenase nickel incorporation protein HypB [Saprospirales bacterium]